MAASASPRGQTDRAGRVGPARPRRELSLPRSTAQACSKSLLTPTAAACARPGCCPTLARVSARPDEDGLDAPRNHRGFARGELGCLYLLSDPLDLPDPRGAGSGHASTVIAHASFLTDALREHADVVFPAETYRRKGRYDVTRRERLRPRRSRSCARRAVRHIGRDATTERRPCSTRASRSMRSAHAAALAGARRGALSVRTLDTRSLSSATTSPGGSRSSRRL